MPVEVRSGQVWEFTNGAAPVRRARVVRVSEPICGVRYVFLVRTNSSQPMRTTLHRLQHEQAGAHLVEDVLPEEEVGRTLPSPGPIETANGGGVHVTVHEPRMSIGDRRAYVARAHRLRAQGFAVAEVAETMGVSAAVVEVWLVEPPGGE